ncbi:hypothetical protein CDO73_07005 [Saccharibacillus sp. O23]|nr:hypothetical protein CDO73_07005 [Saccharibacillus sp. O23]
MFGAPPNAYDRRVNRTDRSEAEKSGIPEKRESRFFAREFAFKPAFLRSAVRSDLETSKEANP